MVTREEIENFLDRISAEGATYREVEQNLWVVNPEGESSADLVVSYSPPVVVLRVNVMQLPADDDKCSKLTRRLLELNASDLVHGSYGIQKDTIILTEALELAHLDFEEFRAAYDGMTLALATHLRELASFTEAR
jgi:hypothetical protein